MLLDVAEHDDETRFGVSRLDADLTLLEAQGMDLVRGHVPVDFHRMRVLVKRDGKAGRVALRSATVDEVRRGRFASGALAEDHRRAGVVHERVRHRPHAGCPERRIVVYRYAAARSSSPIRRPPPSSAQ